MKTKAKSVQTFELRLWSKKHYNEPVSSKHNVMRDLYSGQIINNKTKEKQFIHSAGELLQAIERMYLKAERSK